MCLCTLDTNLMCEIYYISHYAQETCAEMEIRMIATIIISIIILAALAAALRSVINGKKNGCTGNCANCSGCSVHHKK